MTRTGAAGLLVALAVAPARAAKLPDWASAVASSTAPVAAGVPDHRSRVLLADTRLLVAENGALTQRRRLAVQALSQRTADLGTGWFSFTDGAEILVSRAWHVPPGGKAERGQLPALDLTVGSAFLTDEKARLLHVPEIEKGSLVFFEFEARDRLPLLAHVHVFHEDAPVDLARLTVEMPPGWTLRHDWLRRTGPAPLVEAAQPTWELRALEPPEAEPLGPEPGEQVPLLVLSFEPPPGSNAAVLHTADWRAFGEWFERLASGLADPTPAIREAARTALAAAGDDPVARTGTAALWVRDRVRYLAKAVGIGGWQPRSAQSTLDNLYGDCKDKGTLFRALLAAEGIPTYPILVHALHDQTVSDTVPALQAFDHFVVGVGLPPGVAAFPDSMAAAVVRVEPLGPLLVVDVTDELTTPGSVPWAIAGKRGLVVAGADTTVVSLPLGDALAHRVERDFDIEVRTDGRLALARITRYHGGMAVEARAAWRASSVERRRAVESDVARMFVGATVESYAAEERASDGAFVETVRWTAPPPPAAAGSDALLPLFPGAAAELPRVPLGRRKTAVVFPHPVGVSYRAVVRGAGAAAASTVSREGEGWTVTAAVDSGDERVQARWDVALERRRFEPDAFAQLKEFWSAADKAALAAVSLSPQAR